MKLQPIEDHVLIKPINEENTTKSGIILPDSKEKPRKWEVIAVGAPKPLSKTTFLPFGHIVTFTTFATVSTHFKSCFLASSA